MSLLLGISCRQEIAWEFRTGIVESQKAKPCSSGISVAETSLKRKKKERIVRCCADNLISAGTHQVGPNFVEECKKRSVTFLLFFLGTKEEESIADAR